MPKVYIKTYGCQMNKYTSAVLSEELEKIGYETTEDENGADIIIFNTCSVRSHAENRVIGRLNTLLPLKKGKPDLKIGIVGCMAQRLGERLFKLLPHLDFIIGPNDIGRVKEAILKRKACEISSAYPSFSLPSQRGIKAYVPISFGCSNYCSYCIVPYTWGGLKNRKSSEIMKECEELLKNGIVEITLLGQDITSYRDGEMGLADILKDTSKMGIPRIRFLTSHPLRMNDKIIDVIASYKNICPNFHLPLQSGSDRILSLMNRGYTLEYYLSLIEKIRGKIPKASITTDIIVGFPGETKEEFEKTEWALKTIEFDAAFLFKYSPREGTSAYKLREDLSENEKIERLAYLIKIQNEISYKKNKALIGKTFNVLVEGKNQRDKSSLLGRTETDKIVILKGGDSLIGKIIPVVIEKASTYTLSTFVHV